MKTNFFLRISTVLFPKRFLVFYSCFLFFGIFFNGAVIAQCGTAISTFPYTEGFESAASWTIGGSNSSWAWGTPSHPTISSAGGGTKCWCSGGLTGSSYTGAQQAWIASPCFNFSSLNYPWISFKIFWECEYVWDGLVLQYSLNGGSTWTNVGAFGDPVDCMNANWFNHSNISNLSTANPKHGWCGRTGATSGSCVGGNGSGVWVTAKHCLTNLANQASVQFRFLFGSGTTCNSYDGIAIDDILIQDAPPAAANFSYACSGSNLVSFTNLSTLCPTTHTWNFGDPASGIANTSSLQNPSHTFSAPGTYTVSLTSGGPCNAPSTTLIPLSILSLNATVSNLSCNGASNGSSTITASGGMSGYTYTWMPAGGNASVATGLSAGVYTVSVKDISNCVKNLTATISQPPSMSAAMSQTNISCNGLSDGAVSATASLGTPPYSYTWFPTGSTSSGISNLSAGVYSLNIKDANNCLAAFNTTVTQPLPLSVSLSGNSVTCNGGNNGSISAFCTGGTPGYTFTWSPVPGSASGISGLISGNYTVSVKDANNCFASSSFSVSQPTTAVNGSILTTTPVCGGANGSATVTAGGGTPGYSYNWLPTGGISSTASGLAGGTYSVVITDNNNCATTLTTNIAQSINVSVNVNVSNVTCNGLANGSATAIASGGIAPYTYTWFPQPPAGQGNTNVSGIAAGSYSVQVKDVNNCPASISLLISAPAPLFFTYTTNPVSCYGGNNGSISFSANGGSPGYTFSCAPFGTTGTSLNNLQAGSYTVVVKDIHNCSLSTPISVFQPQAPLSAVLTHTNVSCNGFSDGGAKATVNGGTPGYSYTWTPVGGPASIINGLPAGTYTVFVKDINNCTLTAVTSLTQPALPLSGSAIVTSITCYGGNNGGATIIPQGGTPGYTLNPDNPIQGLLPMTYSVLIKDSHQCSTTVTFSIIQPSSVTLSAEASKFCSGQPGVLTAQVSGGASPYNYHWNGTTSVSHTISLTLTNDSAFTVFATDSKGCTSNKETVQVQLPLPIDLHTYSNISVCQGQNAILTASASGGDGNYSFVWEPGNMKGATQNILPSAGRVYTVSVTDGCFFSKSRTVKLDFFPVPVSEIMFSKNGSCPPVCVSFSNTPLLSSGLIHTYQWNFGDSAISGLPSPVHCYTRSGNHLVQLNYMTIHGCLGSQILKEMVKVDPLPEAGFSTDKKEISAYSPTAEFINQSQGATEYTWYFNNEGSSTDENPSFTFFNPGKQMVILIAQNEGGCKDTLVKYIEVKPEFTFFAPNAFSPNNDDLNEIFIPKGMGWNTSRYELVIYDRWGERIFATKNHAEGWDGRVRGSDGPVQNGDYIWKVAMYDTFNQYHEFIGHILIEK